MKVHRRSLAHSTAGVLGGGLHEFVEQAVSPGACGFPAGRYDPHHLLSAACSITLANVQLFGADMAHFARVKFCVPSARIFVVEDGPRWPFRVKNVGGRGATAVFARAPSASYTGSAPNSRRAQNYRRLRRGRLRAGACAENGGLRAAKEALSAFLLFTTSFSMIPSDRFG